MPFAESPWEIELSFGCGWQIESVGILSARSIEAYERERSGRREIPGMGKHFFRGTLYFRDSSRIRHYYAGKKSTCWCGTRS